MLTMLAPLLMAAAQTPEAVLLVDTASSYSNYGESAAISGNWAFVGAPDDQIGGVNYIDAVYVFEYNGSQWVETQKLSQTTGWGDDWFGWPVDIDGDRIAVGSMYSHYPGLS